MKKSKFDTLAEEIVPPKRVVVVAPDPVKSIQNLSHQGLTIYFNTPTGVQDVFLRPKATITVPNSWNSKILETFVRRRLVKVAVRT